MTYNSEKRSTGPTLNLLATRRAGHILVMGVLIMASAFTSASAQTGAESIADLKRKVLSDWMSVPKAVSTARVTTIKQYFRAGATDPLRLTRKDAYKALISSSGYLWLSDVQSYDSSMKLTNRDDSLSLVNTRYRASLKKSKKGDAWVMTSFQRASSKRSHQQELFAIACPWLLCGNVWLPDWISDPSFTISRIEKNLAYQPTAIRIHFLCDPKQRKSKDLPTHVQSGYIDLDPASYSRLLQYEYKIQIKTNSDTYEHCERGTFDYHQGDGVPLLQKVVVECPERKSGKSGVSRSKEVAEFQVVYGLSIPEEEFTLPFYGLPEPKDALSHSTPWYLWLALAAAVCFMVALLSRRYARRSTGKV